jgi:AcrR family transcriptional regulator
VKAPNHASSRDQTRAQLVEVAAHLLATQGPDAVTTRAVALAAGVQAPTIYRLFGDKNGLLDAVAEHGFASYLARKPPVGADADPVESLHAGWELHVGFGLANPELFRLMYTTLRTPQGRAVAATGTGILQARYAGSPRRDGCAPRSPTSRRSPLLSAPCSATGSSA